MRPIEFEPKQVAPSAPQAGSICQTGPHAGGGVDQSSRSSGPTSIYLPASRAAAMQKITPIVATLAVLVGVSHSIEAAAQASYKEKDYSSLQFVMCLKERIPNIDDKISDAQTIAKVVVDRLCRDAYTQSRRIFSQDMDPRSREKFVNDREPGYGAATTMVLILRKKP